MPALRSVEVFLSWQGAQRGLRLLVEAAPPATWGC